MASYSIQLKHSVEKDLRTIPKSLVKRIWERLESLANDPLPRQSIKLAGAEHLYRLRVGEFRIIYGVDHEAKNVTIYHVRHRREAYRKS